MLNCLIYSTPYPFCVSDWAGAAELSWLIAMGRDSLGDRSNQGHMVPTEATTYMLNQRVS